MGKESESGTGTTLHALLRDPTDPKAWERFVERYTPKIWQWCRHLWHLQKTDAQDVTQEVLVKLLQNMRKCTYDPRKGRFRGWLRAVALNAWRDLRQSRDRAGSGGPAEVRRLLEEAQAGDDLLQALEEEFERELLEKAMARVQDRVKPVTWQAFRLLAVEGRSGAEVAAQLNLTVSAAWMAKSRVQAMLREEIERLEKEDPAAGGHGP